MISIAVICLSLLVLALSLHFAIPQLVEGLVGRVLAQELRHTGQRSAPFDKQLQGSHKEATPLPTHPDHNACKFSRRHSSSMTLPPGMAILRAGAMHPQTSHPDAETQENLVAGGRSGRTMEPSTRRRCSFKLLMAW